MRVSDKIIATIGPLTGLISSLVSLSNPTSKLTPFFLTVAIICVLCVVYLTIGVYIPHRMRLFVFGAVAAVIIGVFVGTVTNRDESSPEITNFLGYGTCDSFTIETYWADPDGDVDAVIWLKNGEAISSTLDLIKYSISPEEAAKKKGFHKVEGLYCDGECEIFVFVRDIAGLDSKPRSYKVPCTRQSTGGIP